MEAQTKRIAIVFGVCIACVATWIAWEAKKASDADRLNKFVQGIERRPVRLFLGNPYAIPKILIVERVGDRFEPISGLKGDVWARTADDSAIQMVAVLKATMKLACPFYETPYVVSPTI